MINLKVWVILLIISLASLGMWVNHMSLKISSLNVAFFINLLQLTYLKLKRNILKCLNLKRNNRIEYKLESWRGKMSILTKLNPHKGEVIRVKFKTINDIIKVSNKTFHDTDEYYSLGTNVKAYLLGGDFLVKDAISTEDDTPYIVVQNHLDKSYSFDIHDEVIENIEIVSDAEKFISNDHGIMIVRVEDEMFINGKPLIWDEEEQKTKDRKRGYGSDEVYQNPNRKLLKMFENYIADLAVRESFKDMNEGE